MLRKYGLISSSFWDDKEIRQYSDKEKLLYGYLSTCKHGNAIGLFKVPMSYMAYDLNWKMDVLEDTIISLSAKNDIRFNFKTNAVFLFGILKHFPISNFNISRSYERLVKEGFFLEDELLECLISEIEKYDQVTDKPKFSKDFIQECKEVIALNYGSNSEKEGHGFRKGFERVSKGFRKGLKANENNGLSSCSKLDTPLPEKQSGDIMENVKNKKEDKEENKEKVIQKENKEEKEEKTKNSTSMIERARLRVDADFNSLEIESIILDLLKIGFEKKDIDRQKIIDNIKSIKTSIKITIDAMNTHQTNTPQKFFKNTYAKSSISGPWKRAKSDLAKIIPKGQFKHWIAPLEAIECEDGSIILRCKSKFQKQRVYQEYNNMIKKALDKQGLVGFELKVDSRTKAC